VQARRDEAAEGAPRSRVLGVEMERLRIPLDGEVEMAFSVTVRPVLSKVSPARKSSK
jgi:hypothetical protein